MARPCPLPSAAFSCWQYSPKRGGYVQVRNGSGTARRIRGDRTGADTGNTGTGASTPGSRAAADMGAGDGAVAGVSNRPGAARFGRAATDGVAGSPRRERLGGEAAAELGHRGA